MNFQDPKVKKAMLFLVVLLLVGSTLSIIFGAGFADQNFSHSNQQGLDLGISLLCIFIPLFVIVFALTIHKRDYFKGI
jgi:hypothetical protein